MITLEVKFTTTEINRKIGFSFNGHNLDNSNFLFHVEVDEKKMPKDLQQSIVDLFKGAGTVSNLTVTRITPQVLIKTSEPVQIK